MELSRRHFLLAAAASSVPQLLQAAGRFPNGTLESGVFHLRNGGGDPYRGSLSRALSLAGIGGGGLGQRVQQLIAANPQGNSRPYQIHDGDRLGVMISGHGWVARNTVAWPSQWRSGASRTSYVWYLDDPQYGEVRIMRASVCGNWLFAFLGADRLCRCNPAQGDAC